MASSTASSTLPIVTSIVNLERYHPIVNILINSVVNSDVNEIANSIVNGIVNKHSHRYSQ